MEDDDLPRAGSLDASQPETLADELRGLADNARALAQAEFAYQKSRASYAGKQVGIIAVLVGGALVFLFFAVEALVFGAVLTLAPRLSALGATAVVTASLVIAALLCVALALFRWKKMKAKITEQGD
ncbi:MAG: phage holin family protein [Novosphingobium sp.]|nr:phage holin family protein [Novosphingobium sp.]